MGVTLQGHRNRILKHLPQPAGDAAQADTVRREGRRVKKRLMGRSKASKPPWCCLSFNERGGRMPSGLVKEGARCLGRVHSIGPGKRGRALPSHRPSRPPPSCPAYRGAPRTRAALTILASTTSWATSTTCWATWKPRLKQTRSKSSSLSWPVRGAAVCWPVCRDGRVRRGRRGRRRGRRRGTEQGRRRFLFVPWPGKGACHPFF